MFNHHQDCLLYLLKAFQQLGIEIHVASGELTKQLGFPPGGIVGNKFRIANEFFTPEQVYPDFKNIVFSNDWNGYDKYVSIIPNDLFKEKTWWDCQMQSELKAFGHLDVLKTCNHPDALKFGFQFCPNWVPYQPELKQKKYITQIISLPAMVEETGELMHLKYNGYDVKIVGSQLCPDGFERDYDLLPYTSLLVHNKKVGINCYAVCKALDTGIPVYMERSTKELIGFGDLPDELFLFKEDMNIKQAFLKSQSMDNTKIQDTYRGIYTLERTVNAVNQILSKQLPVPETCLEYHLINCKKQSDINQHLPVLLDYAKKCKTICEMGVRKGVSTWTFLSAKPQKLVSYDIEYSQELEKHKDYAKKEKINYEYRISDVLKTEIDEYDFVFIDTWHTYSQLKQELELHAKKAGKYLGFHDVYSFGHTGEDGKDMGLIPAILQFLSENKEWKISYYTPENNGLLILEK
jgi:predicted O-methyltransferase YrrM